MTYTKEQVEELLHEQRQKSWEAISYMINKGDAGIALPAIMHHAIITSWTEEEERWRAQKH